MNQPPGHALHCHPATPPLAVRSVSARITGMDAHWLSLRWRIEGVTHLVVPPLAGRVRRDNLWQTTCLELFARGEGAAYHEFNLSPSEAWAAYAFTGYRDGGAPLPMPQPPACTWRQPAHGDVTLFDAAVPRAALPALPFHAALCAVIAEGAGHLSYWALAHPRAKPDFHDAAGFALLVSSAEPQ